ncbi:MAG: hypothetical protein M1835_000093 [Candelina submexicana]|nr:MAG: hypothetical protein M1835_000093 [Candelina submexicana]
MSSALLHPSAHLPPHLALRLSQQAPLLLKSQTDNNTSLLIPLLSSAETPERWMIYENLMLSCLRTGDDKSAHLCLQRLSDRFGSTNERVMGLRGLYQEAVAENETALEHVLLEYEKILQEDPTNTPILKRRIALLRSMSRPIEAINALVQLLEGSPTDAEAWSELSDLYQSQSMYAQAIFSLEEVLLITPNAWNIHARMGEIIYLSALAIHSGNELHMDKLLIDSMRYFCRSIELCDGYLRGYYGLKLITNRLLSILPETQKASSAVSSLGAGEVPPPTLSVVQKLNERATSKLAEIIRRSSTAEKGFECYEQAEVIAARELLDRDTQPVER